MANNSRQYKQALRIFCVAPDNRGTGLASPRMRSCAVEIAAKSACAPRLGTQINSAQDFAFPALVGKALCARRASQCCAPSIMLDRRGRRIALAYRVFLI